MMKTSSCSLRSASRFLLLYAAFVLPQPWGGVADQLKKSNPWTAFKDEGPLLFLVRAQRVELGATSCKAWKDALLGDLSGDVLPDEAVKTLPQDDVSLDAAFRAWTPWRQDEMRPIEKCSKLPCDVKLNQAETTRMAMVDSSQRRSRFFTLVLERVGRYFKTQERKEFEFPGDPVDPWKYFEQQGLKSAVVMPTSIGFRARLTDFAPGKIQAIRQVVDRRSAQTADEATVWVRDIYTDHYFDGWGEWGDVSCEGKMATVTLSTLIEFDLLKKTDLISKVMRPKMRKAIEDNAAIYLKDWFGRIQNKALNRAGD